MRGAARRGGPGDSDPRDACAALADVVVGGGDRTRFPGAACSGDRCAVRGIQFGLRGELALLPGGSG